MAAPKTVITIALDGSNRDFEIPFEYLARKFVVVTLIGTDRKTLTLGVDYRFTQRTIITTTQSWGVAEGYTYIELRRVTSATERLVDFSDGSVLRAYDLNISNVQSLHIAEEGRDIATDTIGVDNDGNLDARGRRIVNLADSINPGDAVTLKQNIEWAGSALNQANRAEQQANISTQAAAASSASASRSDTSRQQSEAAQLNSQSARDRSEAARDRSEAARDRAETAAGSAATSSQSASQSAVSAKTDADRSKTEADRAKTEADKLANINEFAATLDSVNSGIPRFKSGVQVGSQYGVLFRKEDLTDPNSPYQIRVTHSTDGGFRFYDDLRGITRANFTPTGDLNVWSDVTAGGVLISRGGIMRIYATGPTANSNLVFHNSDGATRAITYSTAGGDVYTIPGFNMPGASGLAIRMTSNAEIVAPGGVYVGVGGTSGLTASGDVVSSTWSGNRLSTHISRIDAPRRLVPVSLSSATVTTGTILTLSDDVFNYVEFAATQYASGSIKAPFGNLLALAAEPVGTQMYIPYFGSSYILCKFNDTNPAQRRVLQFISFSSGASGFTGFTAYRKEALPA